MTEPRKIRTDLTAEELEPLQKYGSVSFKSVRAPDMRIEPFIPSPTQH